MSDAAVRIIEDLERQLSEAQQKTANALNAFELERQNFHLERRASTNNRERHQRQVAELNAKLDVAQNALLVALPVLKDEQTVRESSFLPDPGESESILLDEISAAIDAVSGAITNAHAKPQNAETRIHDWDTSVTPTVCRNCHQAAKYLPDMICSAPPHKEPQS
jgi:hypothetical protein